MKEREPPIPLRSVVCLPRWLMVAGVALCAGVVLFGVGLAIWGLWTQTGGARGGAVGGAIGCIVGGAGGLIGTLRDWHRRLPGPALWRLLRYDAPSPAYRRLFWPAVAALALGLLLLVATGQRTLGQGLAQAGFVLVCVVGCTEAARRHTTQQAQALFALYADGLLDPVETAAIGDARAKDAAFDAAVRDYQRLAAEVRRLAGAAPPRA